MYIFNSTSIFGGQVYSIGVDDFASTLVVLGLHLFASSTKLNVRVCPPLLKMQ